MGTTVVSSRSSSERKSGFDRPATIRKIGNSKGVILPEEVLAQLHVKEGSKVFFLRTPTGIEVTPYDPEFAKTLQEARDHMRRYRDVFKELARG
ncbi:MAG: AbrB/MazE/SpoVT family DNA-binding domain-containing protein [Nitrospinae bacterium]|nr:AbrB/MazE/SpoVT family DNA-binding domain-containing protein [Nitrospinota bacterium]